MYFRACLFLIDQDLHLNITYFMEMLCVNYTYIFFPLTKYYFHSSWNMAVHLSSPSLHNPIFPTSHNQQNDHVHRPYNSSSLNHQEPEIESESERINVRNSSIEARSLYFGSKHLLALFSDTVSYLAYWQKIFDFDTWIRRSSKY